MTYFIWALLIIIGVPMFFSALGMRGSRFADELDDVVQDSDLQELQPEQVPGIPVKDILKLKEQVKELGFRELLGYHSRKGAAVGMTNYVSTLVSPDCETYADVFYIRWPWMFRILTLLFNQKDFHFYVLGAAFYSAWEDNARLATSPTARVVADIHAQDRSQVLNSASIKQLFEAHSEKLQGIIAERGKPVQFQTAQDYLRFYASRSTLARDQGRKSAEEAFYA